MFLYIRTHHCLTSLTTWKCTLPQEAWIYFRSPVTHRKGISLFYNLLHHKTTFTASTPILRWERDLGQSFTIDKWEKACKSIYKATCCSTLWELAYKLTYCWYMTPDRISKFSKDLDNTHWRKWGIKGDLLHTFWDCPKLTQYWSSIFQLLSEVTHLTIRGRPSLALLSLDIEQYPNPMRIIITHILLAARLSISRKWKDPDPPTLKDVVHTTHVHFTHETTLALRHDKMKTIHM